MAVSQIETELVDVLKLKPKRGEDRQDFLGRIKDHAQDLKEDEWAALTKGAQDWVNAAVESIDEGKDIAEFADSGADEDKPAPKAKAKAKDDKPAAKPAAAKSGVRKASACHRIKELVVKNPKITVEQISEKLKGSDLKVSPVTIATIRSDTRDTLRVTNNAGMTQVEL